MTSITAAWKSLETENSENIMEDMLSASFSSDNQMSTRANALGAARAESIDSVLWASSSARERNVH
jgi:hypothetical protein